MRHPRIVPALLVCLTMLSVSSAQEPPEALLPNPAPVRFRFDGTQTHAEAWKQSAAYEALIASGLYDEIKGWTLKASGNDEQLDRGLRVLEHILAHGLRFGMAAPVNADGNPTPQGAWVLVKGADLQQELESLMAPSRMTFEKATAQRGEQTTRIRFPGSDDPNVPSFQFIRRGPHLAIQFGARNGEGTAVDPLNPQPLGPGVVMASASVDVPGLLGAFADRRFPVNATPDDERTFSLNELLEIYGLNGLQSYATQAGFDEQRSWSVSHLVHQGPRRGFLTLWDAPTFTLNELPPLPADSSSFFVGSMEFGTLYDTLWNCFLATAEKVGPPNARATLEADGAKFEKQLGFRIREDFLAALGPQHAVFSDAANSPAGIGIGVCVQVRNATKLQEIVDGLVKLVPQDPRGPRVVRTKKFGRELISIGQPGVPIWPTVCIDRDWMIVAMSAQMAESFLLRVDGKLPKWTPDAATAAALKELPPAMLSLTVTDPRPMLIGLNQYAQLIPSAAPNAPPLDLPPVGLITKPLFPNVAVCSVADGKIVWSSRDSLPSVPGIGNFSGPSLWSSPVLVALLLPAVQQAREAARRTQSANNLKQIGLALHNYHDTFNYFPAGTVVDSAAKPEDRLSWQVSVTPYIEQAPLYNQLNMKKGWKDQPEPLIRSRLPVYVNPSLPPPADFVGDGYTDYVGIAGLGVDGPLKKANEKGAGAFAYDAPRRIREFTDGTSNTIMVGGVSGNRGRWAQGGPSTIRPFTKQPYLRGVGAVQSPDGFGGAHVGGGHFAFADGSVRFLSENTDPKTLEALVTIQGGEVVPNF